MLAERSGYPHSPFSGGGVPTRNGATLNSRAPSWVQMGSRMNLWSCCSVASHMPCTQEGCKQQQAQGLPAATSCSNKAYRCFSVTAGHCD